MDMTGSRDRFAKLFLACAVSLALITSVFVTNAHALCGDCNYDERIAATDALITLLSSVGLESCEPTRCDTDASASITAVDALAILNSTTGGAAALSCPSGVGSVPGLAEQVLTCQLSFCEESGLVCENGGLCNLSGLDQLPPRCDCAPSYTGRRCEQLVAAPQDLEFYFRWQADCTLPGLVELPTVVPAPEVDLDGEVVHMPRSSAALRLLSEFSIVLDDSELAWDDAAATALLSTIERFPIRPYVAADSYYRVIRSAESFLDDFTVSAAPAGEPWVRELAIADAAFTFANPIEQPPHEGVLRKAYSNRLYRATLRGFFPEVAQLEQILQERFGVAVVLGDPAGDFQYFTYDELVFLLSVFEDYPGGFRNLPNLQELTRRKNGLVNPTYPTAPAIAWVSLNQIEFMDFAFSPPSEDYIHRLLAHELSHFVFGLLDSQTLERWYALSGWAQAESGDWVAATNHNFVSAYAHDINPNEDFAETLSYYIYDPDWVRSIAPGKYDFIFEVVDGYEYVLVVDERVVFGVLNLYPDVTFPGRIVRVTNTVARLADGSHLARMELRINQPPAEEIVAYTRLFSQTGKYVDVYFNPLESDPTTLVAEQVFSSHQEDGYWTARNISVYEASGNTTHYGQSDFGWLLHFENEEVDLEAPQVDLVGVTTSSEQIGLEYHVRVDVPTTDRWLNDIGGHAYLQHYGSGQSLFEYANWSPPLPGEQWGHLVFDFIARPYNAAGVWTFRTFDTWDGSSNRATYDLLDTGASAEFEFSTAYPDTTAPELDLDSVHVEAYPTNPDNPNGETDVYIHYRARDDIAGFGTVSYRLLKPSGQTLFGYHYHDNFYGPYFNGDPTLWQDNVAHVRLPVGSEPGLWALMELGIDDYAGNQLVHNFTELVILAPVENRVSRAP